MPTPPAPTDINTAEILLRAVAFAAERHRHQKRKGIDADPYVNHPINVAATMAGVAGVRDTDVMIAALLHDTVEDTKTTPDELERRFGPTVRRLVAEVTDDKSLPKSERKRRQAEHAPQLSDAAKLIKLADLASNVADLADRPPKDWTLQRKREYVEWEERVAKGCRGVNAALEAHLEKALAEARKALGVTPGASEKPAS